MHRHLLGFVVVWATSTPATAEPASDVVFVQQLVPATAATGLAKTRTIYLNHHGATLSPGSNNSQANTSSIVTHTTHVPGWDATPTDWAATVGCMQVIWAPFDVTVTDVDPGTTPHVEALFGGSPTTVGMPANVGGVSPFSANCAVIENSIVFAFTDNLPKNPQRICEVMSQEIAHSYGLDHELLASDPMTYLAFAHDRAFQDQTVACGEAVARPCGLTMPSCRPNQNSVQLLLSRLGAAGRDDVPPIVTITSPAGGASVAPGFEVSASASDNVAVARVELYLDTELVATATEPPFAFVTPDVIDAGARTISVVAVDRDGNSASGELDVMVTDGTGYGYPVGCSTTGASPTILVALALAFVRRRRVSA